MAGSLSVKRIFVAVGLLAWILSGLFFGGIILALFIAFFTFVGSRELMAMAQAKGLNPPFWFIVSSVFFLLLLVSYGYYDLIFGAFSLIAVLAFLIILFRGEQARVNDVSISLMAIIYAGIFPLHIMLIRDLDVASFMVLGKSFPIGIGFVLMMFLIIAATDIGAFFSGKYFGKRPLWKAISPKKTIEGSVGGTLFSILIAVIFGYFIGLGVLYSIITGFYISLFAQLGDLTESMIKRDVGVKDSGDIFPGHGGVLDRSDSYIITVVTGFYYFKYLVLPAMI